MRDAARVFRGEALMPTGLDALYSMGLREQVLGLPTSIIECWQIYLNRIPVMHINEPVAELGDRAFRAVSQPALLEMLIAEASKHAGFALRSGLSVRGLLSDLRGRIKGVRCHGEDGGCEIEGDLVIGCDGRGSMVRKRSDIALTLLPKSYDILWLKTAVPKEMEGSTPIRIFASGPDAAFTYVSWDGRWQIAWLLQKGEWREMKKRDWLAECAALMPEATAHHLLEHRDDLEGPTLLDVIVGRCASWHKPGVLLLGDAAQPMSPIRPRGSIWRCAMQSSPPTTWSPQRAKEGTSRQPAQISSASAIVRSSRYRSCKPERSRVSVGPVSGPGRPGLEWHRSCSDRRGALEWLEPLALR